MSNEIESKMAHHQLVEFWGGAHRGVCLQVTTIEQDVGNTVMEQMQQPGFVQITMEDAAALCDHLCTFIRGEAQRRQELLRAQLKSFATTERLVFHEVRDLPLSALMGGEFAVALISKYCPKSREISTEIQNEISSTS